MAASLDAEAWPGALAARAAAEDHQSALLDAVATDRRDAALPVEPRHQAQPGAAPPAGSDYPWVPAMPTMAWASVV